MATANEFTPATKITLAAILLTITHAVGYWGLQLSGAESIFLRLTSFQLLVTCVMVLAFHDEWNWKFLLLLPLIGCMGFGIEWVGVHTGYVFGPYSYGKTLGMQYDKVPYLIGINWIVLVYSTSNIVQKLDTNPIVKALLGALLMVAIDYYIEPVAIRFDFWHWNTEGGIIPMQNYVAWYVVSALFIYLYLLSEPERVNAVAVIAYFVQLLFFMAFTVLK